MDVVDRSPSSPDPAAPAAAAAARGTFWLTLYLGTLAALGPLAIDMYLPAFPRIADAFHAKIPDVQRTLATYFVGLALGQLVYGPLADRLGRKRPLYLGLILFTLASGGCALAHSVGSLATLRFAQAMGGCAEMVVSRAIVRDLFDDRRAARVFSSLMLVMGSAPILAPLVGGFLAGHLGWQAIFGLQAAAGAAALVSTALFFRESLPPARRVRQPAAAVLTTYARLLRDRPFMLQAATLSIGTAGLFAYVGGSPYVFERVFGVSEARFGLYFGPIAVGIIGLAQVNGSLASHFDIRHVLRFAMLANAASGLALLLAAATGFGGFWGVYLPLWCFIGSMGFVFPNTTVLAMSPHGRVAGNASALLGSLQFGVSAVGGLLVSAIQNAQRIPTPVPMAATIAACAALALTANLLTSPAPVTPTAADEAEPAVFAAEH